MIRFLPPMLAGVALAACSPSTSLIETPVPVAREHAAHAQATPEAPASGPPEWSCVGGADIVRLTTSRGGAAHVEPEPGLGGARVVWQGDLNEDNRTDWIFAFPDACGNWGECPRGVYVGCGGDRASVVWPPDSYAVALKIGTSTTVVEGQRWRDLVETRRTGKDDEAEDRVLRFDGRGYSGRR